MLRSIAKQSEESVESVLNEQTNELNIGRKVRNKLALDRKCRNIILFISYMSVLPSLFTIILQA